MNIYKRELKAHIKSLVIWCGAMAFLIVAGMGKYSAGAATGPGSMNELMKDMPESLQSLFGVGLFDLSIAFEFFAIMYLYIILMAAVHAVMLGSGIISKEERDKTAEFLLVKPISRSRIITSKLLAAITLQVILLASTFAASYGILTYYSKDAEGTDFTSGLLKLMISVFAIQLLFLSVGAFFAGVFKKPAKSAAAGTAVLMTMFIMSVIVDIVEKANFLKYFSFFKYYDAKDILKREYSPVFPVLSVVFFAALIYAAYHFYKRRDMKI